VRDRDTSPESTTDPLLARATLVATDDEEAPARGFREGLPQSYRSRHDIHCVEELTASAENPLVRVLPLARIDAPPLPDEGTLGDLVRSIREFALLQPLLVRPRDGRF
jgi:hypothetical protein